MVLNDAAHCVDTDVYLVQVAGKRLATEVLVPPHSGLQEVSPTAFATESRKVDAVLGRLQVSPVICHLSEPFAPPKMTSQDSLSTRAESPWTRGKGLLFPTPGSQRSRSKRVIFA